jgi:hypothetical protein
MFDLQIKVVDIFEAFIILPNDHFLRALTDIS